MNDFGESLWNARALTADYSAKQVLNLAYDIVSNEPSRLEFETWNRVHDFLCAAVAALPSLGEDRAIVAARELALYAYVTLQGGKKSGSVSSIDTSGRIRRSV